jgi:hypothetical protein
MKRIWLNTAELILDILFFIPFGWSFNVNISNNWIKITIWTLASVLIILMVIRYIYLCVTPSVNEKIEKRMYYTIVALVPLYLTLLALTCI